MLIILRTLLWAHNKNKGKGRKMLWGKMIIMSVHDVGEIPMSQKELIIIFEVSQTQKHNSNNNNLFLKKIA